MMMRLPNSVQEIADVIGRERALYLIGQLPRCFAGKPGHKSHRVILYVPTIQRLPADHELVRILGWNDAVKLCRAFGGEILQPANCAEIYRRYRDAIVVSMLRAGMTTAHIAAIVGVTDRHVRNLRMEIPQEEIPAAANDNAPIQRKARAANGKSG
ncbi:hypothetical protein RSW36_25170 [Escherichia coli]|uniref:hypothetical protein n=1 Tax=Escherichia coli TaxID=562 RepID=UPI0028DF3D5D|nr:hypothetical protein [Escherichia coli]MDT9046444.1 hypothetical protein [Escherichia coli]